MADIILISTLNIISCWVYSHYREYFNRVKKKLSTIFSLQPPHSKKIIIIINIKTTYHLNFLMFSVSETIFCVSWDHSLWVTASFFYVLTTGPWYLLSRCASHILVNSCPTLALLWLQSCLCVDSKSHRCTQGYFAWILKQSKDIAEGNGWLRAAGTDRSVDRNKLTHTLCKQQSEENTPLLQIIKTDEKVKKTLTQTGG